jgi:hypothetical protein
MGCWSIGITEWWNFQNQRLVCFHKVYKDFRRLIREAN